MLQGFGVMGGTERWTMQHQSRFYSNSHYGNNTVIPAWIAGQIGYPADLSCFPAGMM